METATVRAVYLFSFSPAPGRANAKVNKRKVTARRDASISSRVVVNINTFRSRRDYRVYLSPPLPIARGQSFAYGTSVPETGTRVFSFAISSKRRSFNRKHVLAHYIPHKTLRTHSSPEISSGITRAFFSIPTSLKFGCLKSSHF